MQKFNYHTHTYRCGHAGIDYTDEEYVLDLLKMGFNKMAFTDHCPEKVQIDKRPKIRMKYEERLDYLDNINKLKQKYKDQIRIESGYEVEYMPGNEENLKELKDETDKLILGQHFIYGDNKEVKIFGKSDFTDEELIRYAEYIEKAMSLNIPDIIAHPDIYMFRRNKFGDIEEKVANLICKSAEKYNIPLEINLNNIFYTTYFENKTMNNDSIDKQKEKLNNVVYPCKGFWNTVSKYNIKVVYGIDAHFRGQITLYNELVELANEKIGNEIICKLNFAQDDI